MICGIDEAGRGPVIGPLVVAGFMMDSEEALKGMGVKDSKRLSPDKREVLFEEIINLGEYVFARVTAEEIDHLRSKESLNDIEASLFAKVIEELCPEGTTVYVDAADVDEDNFSRKIRSHLNRPIEIVSKHRADDMFPIVSAASILAKVDRDRRVRKISEDLNHDLGSGYPSDKKTIDFLERWVKEHGRLPKYTRMSWKTSQNILSRTKNKTLDDF